MKALRFEEIEKNKMYWDNKEKVMFQVLWVETHTETWITGTIKTFNYIARKHPKNNEYKQLVEFETDRFYKCKNDVEVKNETK